MRKVFVLVDGTNCSIHSNTNISKIRRLSDSAGYEKNYSHGIGVASSTKIRDVIFAPNFEQKALEILQALLDLNLSVEDKIYIFGYSRGAVIAKTLAMCIVSPNERKAAARNSGSFGTVLASIEFLCLFEPVLGWPRFQKSLVKSNEVVFENRVKNYLELVAYDENRAYLPSDSYSESRSEKARRNEASSSRNVVTTEDRDTALRDLGLLKTRKCVWFPGRHEDVGGHGLELLGAHSLATALEELLTSAEKSETPIEFPSAELRELVADKIDVGGGVIEVKNAWWNRMTARIGKMLQRRSPSKRPVIQHLAHPLCTETPHTTALVNSLPPYPVYQRIVRPR